tara:strand:+ start:15959 stop:16525 length:567 start_codon:yes stop_codon:yes gene_type:complete
MDNFRIDKESGRNHDRQFIAKNRWVLKADHLDEILHKRVKLDMFNQEIEFETYKPVGGTSAQHWIKYMKNRHARERESIALTHFNAAGEELEMKVFCGLEIFGHKQHLDYEETEFAYDTTYVKYDRVIELKGVKCPISGVVHLVADKTEIPLPTPPASDVPPWVADVPDKDTPKIKKPLNLCMKKRQP